MKAFKATNLQPLLKQSSQAVKNPYFHFAPKIVNCNKTNPYILFEALFTFIVFLIVFYINNQWLSLFSIILLLLIASTGIFAMYYGAPYIPSSKESRRRIIDLIGIKKNDHIIELGCGDGRIIREIAGRGVASATGYEFSIPVFLLAKWKKFKSQSKEIIKFGNFWKQDLTNADVLICYLLQKPMEKFEKDIWPHLKKGTRVVSNQFTMQNVAPKRHMGKVYLYIKD